MTLEEIQEWKIKSDVENEHSETTSEVIDWLISKVKDLQLEKNILKLYKDAVDELLIVNFLGVANNNPEEELNKIIEFEIAIHDDPSVSEKAAKRQAVLDAARDILQDLPKDDNTRKVYVGEVQRAMRLRAAIKKIEELNGKQI